MTTDAAPSVDEPGNRSSGALYFPYIRVPDSAWFSNVFLYWPHVASIVPSDYLRRPEDLGFYMQGLVQEGLVRQIPPYVSDVHEFTTAFLHVLGAPHPRVRKPARAWAAIPIHLEKLGGDLARELVGRGVARRTSGPWLEVESSVAERFMTYLAVVLAQASDQQLDPVTDDKRCARLLKPSRATAAGPVREAVLAGLLPAFSRPPEPARLGAFKLQHGAMLLAFRGRVEQALREAVALARPSDRVAYLREFSQAAKQESVEIEAALRGFRWTGLVAWSASGIGATAADLTSGVTCGAVHTLVGAVANVTSRWQRRRAALQRPMAYSVLARCLIAEESV